MVAEATSQSRQPGFALPPGIHRRQAWRPAGLRGVHSILSGIASRTKPFDAQRARLTAWYEQFVRRSQPFIGWQPLTTAELGADGTQSSFGSTQEERITRSELPMISKDPSPLTRPVSVAQDQASATHLRRFPGESQRPQEPLVMRRSISGPIHLSAKSLPPSEALAGDPSARHERQMEVVVQPVAPPTRKETADSPAEPAPASERRRLPAGDGRLAAEDRGPVSPLRASQRNQEPPLVRPALRLAILRPINTAVATVQRKESDPLSSGTSSSAMTETKHFGLEHWPIEAQLAVQPRLVSSMSSLQRQEVRGGFPVNMKGEVRPGADTSSDDLVRVSRRDTSTPRNDGATESGTLGSSREAEIPGPPALPPMALPGIQIRLLRPDESAIQPSGNNVAKPGRSTIASSKPQTPPSAAPPPLDINAVADKVYQTLQRRHQLERERRGLY
jgi:hypothetical protein